jgi:hypothetical protein
MRREGFELGVCPPKVLFKKDKDGSRLEPIEEVVVEVCPPSRNLIKLCRHICIFICMFSYVGIYVYMHV